MGKEPTITGYVGDVNHVHVSWTHGSMYSGNTLEQYYIERSTDNSTWVFYGNTASGTTTAIISYPTNSRRYIRVCSIEKVTHTSYPSTSIVTYTYALATSLNISNIFCNSIDLNWTVNASYAQNQWVQTKESGVWTDYDTILPSGATTQTISLPPTTTKELRVSTIYPDGKTYYSASISGSTLTVIKATNLLLSIENNKDVRMNWVNHSSGGTISIARTYNSVVTIIATGLPYTDTTYLDTTTDNNKYYGYQAVATCSVYGYYSTIAYITTPSPPPPTANFCDGINYVITNTTCGNSNGSINVGNYGLYYDFVLTDVDGNIHALTGLPSDYYFLTATVKQAYWSILGRISCEFKWLKVNNSNTTMTNTGVSVKNIICGGFGRTQGRIAVLNTDSGTIGSYTGKIYNERQELIQTVTGTTITRMIFSPLAGDKYYIIITNNNNSCKLLLGDYLVEAESLRSVAGIKKLWLTEWSSSIEYNYWSESDEDYYLSGYDADFYMSIKLKEFVDSTLISPWYNVTVHTKDITFSQEMSRTKQGFMFLDKLILSIPEANNTKWKELVDVLTKRYILIFLDNNGYYWCMGYNLGALVQGYKRGNNEYVIEFQAQSANKILTNIAYDYVKNSIL